MPPRRTRSTTRSTSNSRVTPYDMTNINNWYSEQFRAKLSEWNIIAPANYSKAELKSLYVANLSHRCSPNYQEHQMPGEVPQTLNPVQMEVSSQETEINRTAPSVSVTNNQTQSSTLTQETVQTSAIVEMMTSMTSLVKKVLDKDQKEDMSKKTLEQFSAQRSSGIDISSPTSSYGIHPELLKNTDYVSESVKEKIVSGKYVNMATLLIPEFEQPEKKDRYRDARLNRSLSIEEFIVAFTKYRRIHCTHHPWRKEELDDYMTNIIDIARVYGGKFYEYHKIFAQKCAVALEQGKKVNWAEKDKDLLQMIIGGTQSNSCQICKEVSHTTQFCPQNIKPFAAQSKYHSSLVSARADYSNASQTKPVCHFFNNLGCRKDKCFYSHVCKNCGSASHGLKQCTAQQITPVSKHAPKQLTALKKY